MSIRNQDWVIKIHFANGTGNGNVLWRLGKDGDFTTSAGGPFPWFSGQHEAAFEGGGNYFLSVHDNGNTRWEQMGGNTRAQLWLINEDVRIANLIINADLGGFSNSQGSIHRLANGNYLSLSGALGTAPQLFAQTIETTSSGQVVYVQQSQWLCYRSWRLRDFYAPVKN